MSNPNSVATTPNAEATKPPTRQASKQVAKASFKPSKKRRPGLSAAPAAVEGARSAHDATGLSAAPAAVEGARSAHDASTGAEGGAHASGDGARVVLAGGENASSDGAQTGGSEGEAAFFRVSAELAALPREEARRINVHVPSAVVLALGALPRLLELRDTMRAELVNPPLDALDKLRDYALAAAYAHAGVLPYSEGETRLRALLTEAAPLRLRLLLSAEVLASFGLLDASKVASIRRGNGHIDTAQDLTGLGVLFRESWPQVASKTAVTVADVDRASVLGGLLLEALGQRQQGTDGANDPREAEDRLAKAYELFFRAYDACRRAVSYLRWREGDAEQIAPSLLKSRRRRRAPIEAPEVSGPDVAAPDADEGAGE